MAKKTQIQNPFFTTYSIPDAYFCDRKIETETLHRMVTNGNNVVLMSSRRMGKSGLIYHLFQRPDIKKNYYTFFIDIYETSSLEELVQKLGKEIVGKLSKKGFDAVMGFLRSLSFLKGVFSVDPSTGMPAFSVGLGDISRPDYTIGQIFDYLEKADKPCIVAIDEFQKIADYQQKNTEAVLRTKIQMMNNTSFIFSGSERSVLSQMFASYSRPFYQSASFMGLEKIDREVYKKFAVKNFEDFGKKINPDAVGDMYDLLQGYTFYLQRTMNECFSLLPEEEQCDRKFIFSTIESILDSSEHIYKDILSGITPNQRALLASIAEVGLASNITSTEFVQKYGLGSVSSVQTAARGLIKRQLISRNVDKQYYLDDKFLELYLARSFGISLEIRLEDNHRINKK
ncbi:MAG: ATP-binding protein [Bacteroidales bacterium]|nr:ATP-binding protein [Bacteroidales bacterium]